MIKTSCIWIRLFPMSFYKCTKSWKFTQNSHVHHDPSKRTVVSCHWLIIATTVAHIYFHPIVSAHWIMNPFFIHKEKRYSHDQTKKAVQSKLKQHQTYTWSHNLFQIFSRIDSTVWKATRNRFLLGIGATREICCFTQICKIWNAIWNSTNQT